MIIRDATSKDFKEVSRIYEQVDRMHREQHPNIFKKPQIPGRPDDYFQNICDGEFSKFVVAESETGVIGFAEAYVMTASDFPVLQPRQWVLIDGIAVDEDIRGTGAGQAMLDYLIDWSKSMAIEEIELKVYSFNTGALKFYERNGFKEINKTLSLKIDE
jgi:ribosomal protein S18 acetylase RimI-like enzyme